MELMLDILPLATRPPLRRLLFPDVEQEQQLYETLTSSIRSQSLAQSQVAF